MLRIDETPIIETYIINNHEKIGGAGEPSTPVIAPALVNALFNSTRKKNSYTPYPKFWSIVLTFFIENQTILWLIEWDWLN